MVSIDVQHRRIDEICACERDVTSDNVVRLGLAFGIDPQFWPNQQAKNRIEVIQRDQGAQVTEKVRAFQHVEVRSGDSEKEEHDTA